MTFLPFIVLLMVAIGCLEIVARGLDRQSRETAPNRLSVRRPESGSKPRRGWPGNSPNLVGSARYLQEKLAVYQSGGWTSRTPDRSTRQPESALASRIVGDQEAPKAHTPTSSLRSSSLTCVDKGQEQT